MQANYGYLVSASNVDRKFYKPLILRVPGLLFVFAITISLIALLEYAAQTLPLVEHKVGIPDISDVSRQLQDSLEPLGTPLKYASLY